LFILLIKLLINYTLSSTSFPSPLSNKLILASLYN